ncbi:hypothetical protein R1sor_008176 [Riccia sorocarpa]|uniref:Protein kinase domain-containing protein n=1 Tax=Riccia sorocarpa TaxID=122646 RepID=A0ABD3HW83_9MARC
MEEERISVSLGKGRKLILVNNPLDMPDVTVGPKIRETENMYKALTSYRELLAMKEVIWTGNEADTKLAEELRKEINLLRRAASHVNIVQYRYIQELRMRLYMEFVSHDTLETIYHGFKLSETQVGLYTRDILSGIGYLHKNNIVHRDVRCANVLVTHKGVCKLFNFGKAKELKNRMAEIKSFTPNMPSVYWMAPEIAAKSQPYQKPVDIWSLGCTVLEMLTRRKPFECDLEEGSSLEEVEVLERLKNHQLPHVPHDKLSTTASEFLKKCLQLEPKNRFTAEDLLGDPFVNPGSSVQFKAPHHKSLSPTYTPKSPLSTLGEFDNQEEEVVDSSEKEIQEECLSLSVEDICGRLSELLESEMEDLSAIMISNAWLKKWQADDDQVYRKLMDAGYAQTFETDTYSCFEGVLSASEEQCINCMPNYAPANEHLNDVAVQECSQDLEGAVIESIESTQPVDHVEVTGTHDQKNLEDLTAALTAVSVEDSKVSGAPSCRGPEHCPPIPLTAIGSASASSTSIRRRKARADMRLEDGKKEYRAHLELSCCFRDKQVCITISSLKGEIFNFPPGAALTETRLSVAAAVDGEMITLVPVDLTNGAERVCSVGVAQRNCDHKKGKNPWYAVFAPQVQTSFGGASLGSIGTKQEKKASIPYSKRDDPLKLVTLSIGDSSGCGHISPSRSVLVLKRHPINTVLAGKDNDLTCIDSHAELTPPGPVTLECNNIYDYVGDTNLETSVEITCCIKMEAAIFPDMHQRVTQEGVISAKRQSMPSVSICEERGTGHATFKGVLPQE